MLSSDPIFTETKRFGAAVWDETFVPQKLSFVHEDRRGSVCLRTCMINSVCTWTWLSGASGQWGYPGTSAVIHVFRGLFKSCIPYFPGEDKLPNTGTWEPEESLGLWSLTLSSQQHTPTHTHTHNRCWKFGNKMLNCHWGIQNCGWTQWLQYIKMRAKMLIGRTESCVVCVNKVCHSAW